MQKRHPERIIQSWAAVDPFKGKTALREARHAIQDLGMLGFHFHPIMGHFAVNDRRLYPLFELINELKVPVMIDVGTTGMGAGMPGGMGAKIRHAHPSAIDELAADFPDSDDPGRASRLALGGRNDGRGPAQGQCVLGAVRLGAPIFSAAAEKRYSRPPEG